MSQLPSVPLSPQQQRQFQARLYGLLGRQVKSYHSHYRMGENSSVPDETAEELIRSVRYTLNIAGGYDPDRDLDSQVRAGQEILAQRLDRAGQLLDLINATVPTIQSQCHWESLRSLDRYLSRYDHLHFAHRVPEDFDYPLLHAAPEHTEGIDRALFLLNCLWLENQILHSFPEGTVETLLPLYPPDYWEAPQNLCEQPLWSSLGKHLLGESLDSLPFYEDQRQQLVDLLRSVPMNRLKPFLENGMSRLCTHLDFTNAMSEYAHGALAQLLPRLEAPLRRGDLSMFFL